MAQKATSFDFQKPLNKNSYSIPNAHILFLNDRLKSISLNYFCIIRTTQNIDCSDERPSLENKQILIILNNLTNKKMKNFINSELVELNTTEMISIDGGYPTFRAYVHHAIDVICDAIGIDR